MDASAMACALVYDGERGAAARSALAKDEHWAAPEHWQVAVFSVIRGLLLDGRLRESRARQAVETLASLTVVSVSVTDLLRRMWDLRGNIGAYDAANVAAAELHRAPLFTADARLARAGGLRCQVRVV
ncbi:MAG TPA: PIN domain-containing protein [Pseudonocardiaceae bacterium]|nr:PIN domain-containing protein [Pseudonocardiaceae bacterium]